MEIPPQNPKKSSGPYQDYRLDNAKNPDKAKRTSKVTKGSATAVPQQSMTMPVILGNATGVVGNALEGGQGVPIYSVVGHPNLTQYVMAPQAVPQQYQQEGGAQGIHPQQPSQSWDGAQDNHPRQLRIGVMPMAIIQDDNQAGILVVPAVATTDIKIHNEIQMVPEATIDRP